MILHQLTVAPNVVFAEPAFKWDLIIEDPDDNKFADLALSTNSDYLVSNDSHFNIFKSIAFPKLVVISLSSFLKILNSTK